MKTSEAQIQLEKLKTECHLVQETLNELKGEVKELKKEVENTKDEIVTLKNHIDLLKSDLKPLFNFYKIASGIVITGLLGALLALILK